ncbi:MAG: molecular chaperone DnaK [Deltaproteobacteria bacterium HGW-Deltaproteobacteria-15]|nr:MAG: molecular chaperone DnaK [Deltaproteobacteria bacterium HGW-Deltaproteobacteria-15]
MNQLEKPETPYHFIIGIDLGTTNSAVAYVRLTQGGLPSEDRTVRFMKIPQLVAAGEIDRRPVLPSFLYIPGSYDLPPESMALPWDPERKDVVGEFAREQGALVPGRLVSSAKSWLAHGGVDRTSPILPWGEASVEKKISPVEASARYLLHMRESWNYSIAKGREEYALENQLVVITVPASFDEVARELTVSAARQAGIGRFVLLEEPLAAFYAWISRHESDWQSSMKAGQIILVCDVGGGTTDFTIVAVREGEMGLRFDRLAVGDHLILGGDNMDHALGRFLEKRLMGQPGKLDTRRWRQLSHQCRKAKEVLLNDQARERSLDITIMGSGGKLIGSTLKTTVTRDEVRELVMDGFFPMVSIDEVPQGERRRGLTEWGLPYAQDPAVTRHMSDFWKRFHDLLQKETGRDGPVPDYLLFNGGALGPAPIRKRLREVVKGWFQDIAGPDWAPKALDNPHPELAVAIGAAYYGLVRAGEGIRIGAGSPRSYYVEVVAGDKKSREDSRAAVCLVPRGSEEGFETQLLNPAFEVLANQPVSFQLFSSSTRLGDRLGDVVELNEEEISIIPPIRTVLRYGKKAGAVSLPVQLAVRLTEVGTLEVWCESRQTPHRWRLQFDVRQEVDSSPASDLPGETLEQAVVEKARDKIRSALGGGTPGARVPPESITKDLEEILDTRKEKWSIPLARKLADALLDSQEGRKFSQQHEERWFNLLGFCLRPGFGDPADEWRMNEVWKIYLRGMQWPNRVSCRVEFWIFLRRVAGGLTAGRQLQIYREVSPALQTPGTKKSSGRIALPSRLNRQEETEIWMALANCERLSVEDKISLGRLLLQKMRKSARPQEYWALSRFGTRVPLYGPLNRVIPGQEASSWIRTLFSLHLPPKEAVGQALVQLARLTGDRERDVPEEDRQKVASFIENLQRFTHLQQILMNREPVLTQQEKEWMFGEALPSGLVLSE